MQAQTDWLLANSIGKTFATDYGWNHRCWKCYCYKCSYGDAGAVIAGPGVYAVQQALQLAIQRAANNGGITRYNNKAALTLEQQEWRQVLIDLGINKESANQLFGTDIDTYDKLKYFLLMILKQLTLVLKRSRPLRVQIVGGKYI